MPQIGELGPGVWLASGFGGHGLNTTAMAGNIIARAIVDGDQTWRQFTPFELVWAGGMLGRAAAQARSWGKRLDAAIGERRAKAREMAHARAIARTQREALDGEREAALAASEAAAAERDSAAGSIVPPATAVETVEHTQRSKRRRAAKSPAKGLNSA